MAGKLDEVEAEAKKMVAEPKYRYINFETKINDAGYNMINGDKMDAAIYIFQLNIKLFPKSANAWDSLAEAYWKSKQTDKAIEHYNKAIELDPTGPVGDNARNMLKQIKAGK